MFDIKILTVTFGIFAYLYSTDVGPFVNRVQVEGTFSNISRSKFFNFITNPDVFNRWFRWSSHVRYGDHKLIGINKTYLVEFLQSTIVFEVKNYNRGSTVQNIQLESQIFFRPSFTIEVESNYDNYTNKDLKLIVTMNFNRRSLLFRTFAGKLLQHIADEKITKSVERLQMILDNFSVLEPEKLI